MTLYRYIVLFPIALIHLLLIWQWMSVKVSGADLKILTKCNICDQRWEMELLFSKVVM